MFSLRNLDLGDYTSTMKKAVIVTTIALSSLSFQQVAAAEEKTDDLEKIYHVYNNEQFAGTISEEDKKALDQHLSVKLDQVKKNYPDKLLEVDQDVTFIEENIFHNDKANTNALESLKNDVQIEAQATAFIVDGQEVAYVASREDAERILRQFTLQYVSAEELAQFENKTQEQEAPLTSSGSRLKSLTLSEDIEFADVAVNPTKIMDEASALAFLNKGSHEVSNYTVKESDAIDSIAAAYQLTTDELLTLNPGLKEDSLLQVGQTVKVAVPKPVIEVTVQRELFKNQAIPYERKVVESDDLNKGDSKLKQAGQAGEKETHYYVTQTNGKQVAQDIISDEVTKNAVPEVRIKGTKEAPSTGNGQLTWPTVGGYISSEVGYRWGKMHKGIDIAQPSDLTIKAADNGVVVSAGYNNGGYGNRVEIDHGNGMKTTYSHMSSINVQAGQTITAGTKIGVMGSTGDSTGVHLHFELFMNGSVANPLDYL
ncbi:M23 family metallopeptidase [Bacillus sp. JJ722]|uniref:M23 family metallopeptidase n=1 Tax=Bacillus sp. JJ722 TaxID=3122973 RepID=UPI002FFDB8E7